MSNTKPVVAVLGAGPAGIYGAEKLANAGAEVVIFNRDIKPGGLAEYGIFFDKYKMKDGLRKQFRKILAAPDIHYYGNVVIGRNGDFTLDDLRGWGFDAILTTVGAQGTKWLGLPGEELKGVYHAKDCVYHYNHLPPFSETQFNIGRRMAVIGAGNVMLDIANWAVRYLKLDELVAIVRRDASAVKFTKKEMQGVAANLDLEALDAEIARIAPVMQAVGADPEAAKQFILSALPKADPKQSDTRFRFDFLASPKAILGDENGQVVGLEVEETTLTLRADGSTSARGTGATRVIEVDTVIFAIGDTVDEDFGLPVTWSEFSKHPEPRYPVEGVSYELYDSASQSALEGLFVAGWARQASTGLVGAARKDGTNGAAAVAQYLAERPAAGALAVADVETRLAALGKPVVNKADWQKLESIEQQIAAERGLEEFKFDGNGEMLAAIGR
jgi:ferredoxin--NADP+ reductase